MKIGLTGGIACGKSLLSHFLNELGIETYGDLLEYYPYKYIDRLKIYTIHELTGDMHACYVIFFR